MRASERRLVWSADNKFGRFDFPLSDGGEQKRKVDKKRKKNAFFSRKAVSLRLLGVR